MLVASSDFFFPQVSVIHVDVNKTLLWGDQRKTTTPEQDLCATFPETFKADWNSDGKPLTFANYVRQIKSGLNRDEQQHLIQNWQKTLIQGPFSHSLHTAAMISAYQTALVAMRTLPAYTEESSGVFSSFFNFLERLKERELCFVIVLRSFGDDLQPVAKAIAERTHRKVVFGKFLNKALHLDGENCMTEPLEIFKRFARGQSEVFAIQDSYQEWSKNAFKPAFGKPFILSDSARTHTVFIDDMANGGGNPCSVVYARYVHQTAAQAQETVLSTIEAEFGKRIFQADAVQAMLDPHYFIDLFNKSLEASGLATI